ncbi:MAG: hypothetical protein H7263_12615 [Candidatus Sericytochromatia bacterium]|nr:hypothetical protein [Candidatus Sericytochromatia bacterium]
MNKINKLNSYIIRKYILLLGIVGILASIIMNTFVLLDSFSEDGQRLPFSSGMRYLLSLNSLFIIIALISIIIFFKKKTQNINDIEDKIAFFENNKVSIRKKFNFLLIITLLPSLFIAGNNIFDTSEIRNIPCKISFKDFTENKKSSLTYYLKFKCKDRNEYKLFSDKDIWLKTKLGDKLIMQTKSGAFGLERIRKILL